MKKIICPPEPDAITEAIDLLEANDFETEDLKADFRTGWNLDMLPAARVHATGSIRGAEMQEAFEAAYAKHDYKLADYLRQLSETDKPTIQ